MNIYIYIYVHGTMHLSNTSHINSNEMQLFFILFYLVLELYMFRTAIIRSTINCSGSHWC